MKSPESVIPEGLTNGQRHCVGSSILHRERRVFEGRHLRVAKEAQATGDLPTADNHASLWLQENMDRSLRRVTEAVVIALISVLSFAGGRHHANAEATANHQEIASCLEGVIAGGGADAKTISIEDVYNCEAGYSEK